MPYTELPVVMATLLLACVVDNVPGQITSPNCENCMVLCRKSPIPFSPDMCPSFCIPFCSDQPSLDQTKMVAQSLAADTNTKIIPRDRFLLPADMLPVGGASSSELGWRGSISDFFEEMMGNNEPLERPLPLTSARNVPLGDPNAKPENKHHGNGEQGSSSLSKNASPLLASASGKKGTFTPGSVQSPSLDGTFVPGSVRSPTLDETNTPGTHHYPDQNVPSVPGPVQPPVSNGQSVSGVVNSLVLDGQSVSDPVKPVQKGQGHERQGSNNVSTKNVSSSLASASGRKGTFIPGSVQSPILEGTFVPGSVQSPTLDETITPNKYQPADQNGPPIPASVNSLSINGNTTPYSHFNPGQTGQFVPGLVQSSFQYGQFIPDTVQSSVSNGQFTPVLDQSLAPNWQMVPDSVQPPILTGQLVSHSVHSSILDGQSLPYSVHPLIKGQGQPQTESGINRFRSTSIVPASTGAISPRPVTLSKTPELLKSISHTFPVNVITAVPLLLQSSGSKPIYGSKDNVRNIRKNTTHRNYHRKETIDSGTRKQSLDSSLKGPNSGRLAEAQNQQFETIPWGKSVSADFDIRLIPSDTNKAQMPFTAKLKETQTPVTTMVEKTRTPSKTNNTDSINANMILSFASSRETNHLSRENGNNSQVGSNVNQVATQVQPPQPIKGQNSTMLNIGPNDFLKTESQQSVSSVQEKEMTELHLGNNLSTTVFPLAEAYTGTHKRLPSPQGTHFQNQENMLSLSKATTDSSLQFEPTESSNSIYKTTILLLKNRQHVGGTTPHLLLETMLQKVTTIPAFSRTAGFMVSTMPSPKNPNNSPDPNSLKRNIMESNIPPKQNSSDRTPIVLNSIEMNENAKQTSSGTHSSFSQSVPSQTSTSSPDTLANVNQNDIMTPIIPTTKELEKEVQQVPRSTLSPSALLGIAEVSTSSLKTEAAASHSGNIIQIGLPSSKPNRVVKDVVNSISTPFTSSAKTEISTELPESHVFADHNKTVTLMAPIAEEFEKKVSTLPSPMPHIIGNSASSGKTGAIDTHGTNVALTVSSSVEQSKHVTQVTRGTAASISFGRNTFSTPSMETGENKDHGENQMSSFKEQNKEIVTSTRFPSAVLSTPKILTPSPEIEANAYTGPAVSPLPNEELSTIITATTVGEQEQISSTLLPLGTALTSLPTSSHQTKQHMQNKTGILNTKLTWKKETSPGQRSVLIRTTPSMLNLETGHISRFQPNNSETEKDAEVSGDKTILQHGPRNATTRGESMQENENNGTDTSHDRGEITQNAKESRQTSDLGSAVPKYKTHPNRHSHLQQEKQVVNRAQNLHWNTGSRNWRQTSIRNADRRQTQQKILWHFNGPFPSFAQSDRPVPQNVNVGQMSLWDHLRNFQNIRDSSASHTLPMARQKSGERITAASQKKKVSLVLSHEPWPSFMPWHGQWRVQSHHEPGHSRNDFGLQASLGENNRQNQMHGNQQAQTPNRNKKNGQPAMTNSQRRGNRFFWENKNQYGTRHRNMHPSISPSGKRGIFSNIKQDTGRSPRLETKGSCGKG